MAHFTGTSNESRRPRPSSSQLPDMRQGRPQLSFSGPATMAPSFAPPGPVPPGAAPPGAVPHGSVGSSNAVPVAPAPYVRKLKMLCYVRHPDVTSHASTRTRSMEHCGKETSGAMAILEFPSSAQDRSVVACLHSRTGEITGVLRTSVRLTRQQLFSCLTLKKKKRKSAKAAASRRSAPVGKKMHKHGAGPRCFLNLAYKMMVDQGLDELPSFTALARMTHCRSDGSFIDERTKELVLGAEEAVDEMLEEGSPLGDSPTDSTAATNSKRFLLNQEYIKVISSLIFIRGLSKKGTIYGLGSIQYKNASPAVPVHVSLKRNLDVEMRLSGFETTISKIKEDVNALKTGFKEAMSANEAALNLILQSIQSQASNPTASTAQPFQPEAQSQPQGQPQAPVQSQPQPQVHGESTAEPHHHMTHNQSDLDRWCQNELGL
ncbi:hypothetical protein Bca101_010504 [Brassica carinata]